MHSFLVVFLGSKSNATVFLPVIQSSNYHKNAIIKDNVKPITVCLKMCEYSELLDKW